MLANFRCPLLRSVVVLLAVLFGRWCCCLSTTGSGSRSACVGRISPYLEAAYKCVPDEFRERIKCEGERLKLTCPKTKYIVIYNAELSQPTETDCPSRSSDLEFDHSPTDCPRVCVRQSLISSCQGRRRCSVEKASLHFPSVFSEACPPLAEPASRRVMTRVIYVCVSKFVLRVIVTNDSVSMTTADPCSLNITDPRSRSVMMEGFPRNFTKRPNFPSKSPSSSSTVAMATTSAAVSGNNVSDKTWSASVDRAAATMVSLLKLDSSITKSPPDYAADLPETLSPDVSESQTTVVMVTAETVTSVSVAGVMRWSGVWWYHLSSEWTWSYRYIADNREKFFLYLALSISFGVVFILFTVILRLSIQKPLASTPRPHSPQGQRPSTKTDQRPSSRQATTMSYTSPITWRLPDIDPSIAGDERPGRGCEVQLTSFNRLNSLPRVRKDSVVEIPPLPSPSSTDFVVKHGGQESAAEAVVSTTATISRSHLNCLDSHSIGEFRPLTTDSIGHFGLLTTDVKPLPTADVSTAEEPGLGAGTGSLPPVDDRIVQMRQQYSLPGFSVRPFGSFGRTSGGPCGQEFRELNEMTKFSKTLELPPGNRYFCT